MTLTNRRLFVRPLQALCIMVLSLAALWSPADADDANRRVALVVGNQTYSDVAALDNPVSDARLIAAKLEEKGFAVTLLADAGQVELNHAIAQFGRDLRSGGEETTGLFYYAGHAVQSFGANYLLPVDTSLTDAADLSLVAVRADAVLRQMASAQNRTNIVILDACRNNPFVDIPDMNDNGLAEMKAPTGTFMAYSTAPGSVALDGTDTNSPYTTALAVEMDVEGLPIEQVFKQVRGRVLDATERRQTPWDTTSLTRDFYFTPAVQRSPEDLAAERFFESIKLTRDPVQIVLFLRTYPESEYFDAARTMLSDALDGGDDTAAAPVDSVPVVATPPAPLAKAEVGAGPDAREKELIGAAQTSGEVADYEAYLDAFPNGVFAELARTEIAAKVAKDPDAPEGGTADADVAQSAPKEVPVEPVVPDTQLAEVLFDVPLAQGGPEIVGQTLETLIAGSPLFPPIEGLPDAVWKERSCATCHEWTREALCDQANTYLAEGGTRSLNKEHPYGGGFKRNLRDWASGGCR